MKPERTEMIVKATFCYGIFSLLALGGIIYKKEIP
jgi:hypothetical protein